MKAFLESLLSSDFMPHGYCYLWKPEIILLHSISDGLITASYYLIPVLLIRFVRQRHDLPFHWMFAMFGVFIFGCGTTHLMEVWTLWHGTYWLAGVIKAITAVAFVGTAVALVPIIPRALALPSPAALEREIANRLQAEQALSQLNHELEARVQQRTSDLQRANERLVSEIDQRQRVEAELRETEAILRHHQEELQSLAGRLIRVQEDERRRIARELHDDLSQRLALQCLSLDLLLQKLPSDSVVAPELAKVRTDSETVMRDVREISHNLHHPQLALGLPHGAASFCQEFSEQHGVVVDLISEGDLKAIPAELSVTLFRVLQEALTNVAKHSGAESCAVALRGERDRICLRVTDRGRGFQPGSIRSDGGLGLISMRERLRLVNGTLSVVPSSGGGTDLEAVIPLVETNAGGSVSA